MARNPGRSDCRSTIELVTPQLDHKRLDDDALTVDRATLDAAMERADFVVLPERIREVREVQIAPFRREVSQFQHFVRDNDHSVALALPEGVETAAYQEHAAEWVLPVIALGATVGFNVACNLIADWIWMVFGPKGDPEDTVHVRLARRMPDGTLEMVEARGAVGDVVRVLREPLESGEAD